MSIHALITPQSPYDWDFSAIRYNADGTVDTPFGNNGETRLDSGSGNQDSAVDVAIDSQGRYVVVGMTSNSSNWDNRIVLYRLNTDGTLDTTFGTNGYLIDNIVPSSGSPEDPREMVIDSQGRIIVAGMLGDNGFALRVTADGAVDSGFTEDGLVTIDYGGTDWFDAVTVDSNGKNST